MIRKGGRAVLENRLRGQALHEARQRRGDAVTQFDADILREGLHEDIYNLITQLNTGIINTAWNGIPQQFDKGAPLYIVGEDRVLRFVIPERLPYLVFIRARPVVFLGNDGEKVIVVGDGHIPDPRGGNEDGLAQPRGVPLGPVNPARRFNRRAGHGVIDGVKAKVISPLKL